MDSERSSAALRWRDHVLSRLRAEQPELRQRFGVESIQLFGSTARGEAGPQSDVDLLATFDRPVSLFDVARLEFHLEDMFGRSVQVVTPGSVRSPILERITHDAVPV